MGGAVQGLFQPVARGAVDAHVVYRLWPGCPTLLARTTEHGYTVMTPLDEVDPDGVRTAFVGQTYEETGLFEGPVREGQSVFRYIPPAASETWDAGGADVRGRRRGRRARPPRRARPDGGPVRAAPRGRSGRRALRAPGP